MHHRPKTKMKRKYEESPSRSNERNHKISLHTNQKTIAKEIHKSSKKTTNNVGNSVLRRSTRKATIERRVWAEPRREKQIKIPKDFCNNVSKRGRPKKKIRGNKIFSKNIINSKVINKNINSYQPPKKCHNDSEPETASMENEVSSSVHNNAEFCPSDDNLKEGMLVIDDQVSSLNGAIVDEVIENKPVQVSCSAVSSQCQNNLLVNSVSESAIDNNLYDNWSTNTPLNLTVSSKSKQFNNIVENSENKLESNTDTKNIHSSEPKNLVSQSFLSSNTPYGYKEIVGSNTNKYSIKDDLQNICNKMKYNATIEEKKDDNHVSLSEALAKLVDSEESGHGSEAETVTIHPFSSSDDLKQPYNHITLGNNISLFPISSTHSTAAVVIPADSSSSFTINSDQTTYFASQNDKGSEYGDTDEKESSTTSSSSHCDEVTQCSKSPVKHPVPPLIKISRSPVIKTPLKCSECPMRFCTVRSLLWHFGTHEPFRKNTNKGEIVLENLLASWDKPDTPVQILKRKDNDNSKFTCDTNTECKYFPCSSDVPINGQKLKNRNSASKIQNETSRDCILKVPIPKLMHKSLGKPSLENNRFCNCNSICNCPSSPPPPVVSIIPRTLVPSTTTQLKNSNEENPELSIKPKVSLNAKISSSTGYVYQEPSSPVTSIETGINNYSPQHSVTKYSSSTSSNQKMQTNETCKEEVKSSQTPITVIPVEELGKFRRQMQNGATELKEEKGSCREMSESPLLEEDGLVVINSGLALRIVNSTNNEGLSSANQSPSCLTILPQNKDNSGTSGKVTGSTPPPDILTIVPQSNPSKSCLKSSPGPSPQLMTAVGKVSADASQVVKLILVPPKADVTSSSSSNSEKHLDEGWESSADISDGESDEGEMVIDIKEEEASMDPLSLCAVTMEEELHDVPSSYSPAKVRISKPNNPDSQTKNPNKFDGNVEESTPSTLESCKKHLVKLDEEKYLKRKYVCRFCQKRFGWSTDLKRHVILHTGERPFKCKWCPITFTRKFLLQNHMKKIHSQLCKWSDLWE